MTGPMLMAGRRSRLFSAFQLRQRSCGLLLGGIAHNFAQAKDSGIRDAVQDAGCRTAPAYQPSFEQSLQVPRRARLLAPNGFHDFRDALFSCFKNLKDSKPLRLA